MKPMQLLGTATMVAVLTVAASPAVAQSNTLGRTFLTFSSKVELPNLALDAGTYVFKLADTQSRGVVQVWKADESEILSQWLYVQASRPAVSGDTVVMFRETPERSTPAIQYWYYPGERIGKEFIYPRDQAERIAARTGQLVKTLDTVDAAEAARQTAAARPPVAAAQQPPAARPTRLPQTASLLPLTGLIGLLSLAGAAGVRLLRRRR